MGLRREAARSFGNGSGDGGANGWPATGTAGSSAALRKAAANAFPGGAVRRGSSLPGSDGGAVGDVPGSGSPSEWTLAGLSGRLVEVSGDSGSASLTIAMGLVREAQLLGEPAAWITLAGQSFFPPDAAAGGVDLAALAVVRLNHVRDLKRAADQLARSGAFGLLIVDLPEHASLPMAAQSRLLGLAQKHGVAVVFLTRKAVGAPSLGSLISLRAQTKARRVSGGGGAGHDGDDGSSRGGGSGGSGADLGVEGERRFVCEFDIVKDKRRAPGWRGSEVCHGPTGLC